MDHMTNPNLSRACRTLSLSISHKTVAGNDEAFDGLLDVLRQAYPHTFSDTNLLRVGEHAALLCFTGHHSPEPLLFTGHMDVAPVACETLDQWVYPPFSGMVADGFIWGRGAIDMKGHLVALLEAIEEQLESGSYFKRDIWVALSANEEMRGMDAQAMFRILKAQGVRPAITLDEGIGVMEGQWGVAKPMAMIGIGEKGHVNLTLNAQSAGGHGAYPPERTALQQVVAAGANLSALSSGSMHVTDALTQTLMTLAPYVKPMRRIVFRHPALLRPLTFSILRKTDLGRSLLMTTAAMTTASGSAAANMLPESASITLNCRILQNDTTAKAIKRAESHLASHHVKLTASANAEPSRISPARGPAWDAIVTAVSVHFPDAVPVPCVISGSGDARRYEGLCDHIYRFSPFELSMQEQSSKHAVNERLSLVNLEKGILFFSQILKV
jgi:carboxypeptidase PM20D1